MIVESVDPSAVVNRVVGNSIDARVGVRLPATAQRVAIGGATSVPGAAPGNTINAETGVQVDGNDNTIAGNLIDRVGAHSGTGVSVDSGTGTIIGGSTPASGNRITGYAEEGGKNDVGIRVDNNAHDTRVQNNVIGVAADGRTAAPNLLGVLILGPGTTLENNVVSGHAVGVSVLAPTAVVRGNRIGTDASGSFAIPNGRGLISQADLLGGTPTAQCDGSCNLISGNEISGVEVQSGRLAGNFVGTDVTGTQPIPNGNGVVTKISDGPTSVSENLIAFNSGAGVLASGSQTRAEFRSNRIFGNGGLGIDLTSDPNGDPDGVTQNGTSSGRVGPNALQNFPVMRAPARQADGRLLVQGQLSALSLTATYVVDLYWNQTCDQPSGHGEGEVFAASTSIPGIGLGAFDMGVTQPEGYRVLTATATGPTGTSEFSACFNLLPQTALSGAAAARERPASRWRPTTDSWARSSTSAPAPRRNATS